MAIAFDTSQSSNNGGGSTTLTFSHTCSGSDRLLVVGVAYPSTSITISSVTYTKGGNVTNLTAIDQQAKSTPDVSGALYYMIAPDTGAHNIVITVSSNTAVYGASASYTGVNQSTQPDAHNKVLGSSLTLSVVNPNCWIVASSALNHSPTIGISYSAGSGFTLRQSQNNGALTTSLGLEDSNATVSTGNNTVAFGASSGSPDTVTAASFSPKVSTLYWVGGTGTWDTTTTTHWASSSGGTGGYSVPDSTIAVIFDGNSGGGTVTTSGTLSCTSITGTGFTGGLTVSSSLTISGDFICGTTLDLEGSSALNIGGSLSFSGGTYAGTLTFTSTSTGKTITSNSHTFSGPIVFNGVGGGWTLSDNLTSGTGLTTQSITITNGTVDFNGKTVQLSCLTNSGTLTLGAALVALYGTGTVLTCSGAVNSGTSTIYITDTSSASKTFAGNGKTYYNLQITSGGSGTYTISGNNTFNNLYLTGTGTGTLTISGTNTFNDFKADTPPHTILLGAGLTQSFQTFTVNGTAGNLMTLHSTTDGTQWRLFKTVAGNVSCDYLSLKDSFAESSS